ncbi:hypothetical protein AAULR_23971 [Lacticaseibacillus rhamnosus MTCC 5462]|nr:hypothetical protein AAULR_23971 [Lacticaseibacillus rhamnosus MTCC 5462]
MGHEFSGTVAKMGANIEGFKEGERVAVAPLLPNPKSIYTKWGYMGLVNNTILSEQVATAVLLNL